MLQGSFPPGVEVVGMPEADEPWPETDEDQPTFAGNAAKKAIEAALWSNQVVMAEDSGLVVPTLDHAPGVHSKRFGGPAATDHTNNLLLIERLQGHADRTACYISVIALAMPPGAGTPLLDLFGFAPHDLVQGLPLKPGYPGTMQGCAVMWWEGKVQGEIVDEPRGHHGFGYDPHFYLPKIQRTMAELPLSEKNELSHRAHALLQVRRQFEEAQL